MQIQITSHILGLIARLVLQIRLASSFPATMVVAPRGLRPSYQLQENAQPDIFQLELNAKYVLKVMYVRIHYQAQKFNVLLALTRD